MRSAPQATAKDLMLAIIDDQPAESSYDDILRQLAFHRMVERGLADAERGATISADQLRARIKAW